MANKAAYEIPTFVEDPNIKNEVSEDEIMDYQDPYDSANGEYVEKEEVKNIDLKTIHRFLMKQGDGILSR